MKPSRLVSVIIGLAFLSACPPARSRAPNTPAWTAPPAPVPAARRPRPAPRRPVRHLTARERAILAAEKHASPGGRAVLVAARHMIDQGVVVRGSCWDFAHAVYARAGFGSWRRQRRVYRARTRGPYANPSRVRAGDWLYIINHRATLATHSVIFVRWVDRLRRRALVITYVGGQRDAPGHYRSYDVSRIYHIIRPKVRKAARRRRPRPRRRARHRRRPGGRGR